MTLVVKNLPATAGDARSVGSILRSGRSPGGGDGNLFLYSCLKIPWAEEPGGLQSWGHKESTQLTPVFMHAQLGLTLCNPCGLKPARILCPWGYASKKPGASCHFLLQEIFPTQGSTCISCIGRRIHLTY